MSQFRSTKLGGLGIEELLDELAVAKGEALPAASLTDPLRLLAYQTAVAGVLAREHDPKMKAKEWQSLADQMRDSAVDLAVAVKAKDGKTAYQAVMRLNGSCNQCHKVFRK
jgi:hypothetical protein